MGRRSPIDDRELLRLLEAGRTQSEVARVLGYPVGTVTAKIKRLRDRGILGPGDVVDWEKLDQWERDHLPAAYRDEVIPEGIPDVIPAVGGLDEQEVKGLREVLGWWKKSGRNTFAIREVIPESSKSRRTYWIEDVLHEAVRDRAEQEGVSIAELVNAAIRAYLQGGGPFAR